MRHADKDGRTTVLEAIHTGSRRGQHLLGGAAEANGIEDKIRSTIGDL